MGASKQKQNKAFKLLSIKLILGKLDRAIVACVSVLESLLTKKVPVFVEAHSEVNLPVVSKTSGRIQLLVLLMIINAAMGITAAFQPRSHVLAASCDRTAATLSALNTQVTAATAGQTICLSASINYGTWTGTNKAVTIMPQSGQTPTLGIDFNTGDSGFILSGLTIPGGGIYNGARDITIKNSTFTGILVIDGVYDSNILLDNNTHNNINVASGAPAGRISFPYGDGVRHSGVTVQNSVLRNGCTDGVQAGVGVNIINNEFDNIEEGSCPNDPHTDSIQLLGAHGSVVRGNYIHDGSTGIVAYDGISGTLIENNVVGTDSRPDVIELLSDANSIVRHNTLIYKPAGPGCGNNYNNDCGYIYIGRKPADPVGVGTVIENNITAGISVNDGSTLAVNNKNMFRTGASGTNINGIPSFTGGANPTTYAGFNLAFTSPGKKAASDSADVGANVTIGAAATQMLANLWVDTNGGNCVRQAVPGNYIDAKACSSMQAAYMAALSGDFVSVKAGNYGPQHFAGARDPSTGNNVPGGTKTITYKAEPGNKVKQMGLESPNITLDGFNIDADGEQLVGDNTLWIGGYANITFKNGRVGNVKNGKAANFGGENVPTLNLVIDNVEFHDAFVQVDAQNPDPHLECIQTQSPGLTVRNSRFTNCDLADISIVVGSWWGQQPYGNVTLENNVFGHSTNGPSGWHYTSVWWYVDAVQNIRMVNNTFEQSMLMEQPDHTGAGPYSGVIANNLGNGWACLPGVTYSGNVGQYCPSSAGTGYPDIAVNPASGCGPTPDGGGCTPVTYAPFGFVNPASKDFHLLSSSVAKDKANPAYAPSTDKDFNPRPVGVAPDAGAYEYGSTGGSTGGGTTPPVTSGDRLTTNQTLNKGSQLTSTTGGNKLVFQNDGNVVLYSAYDVPLWSSQTSGSTANRLVMQGDGNLVLYNASNVPLWYTRTSGSSARMVVQGDGNLVVYNGSNAPLWYTGTNAPSPASDRLVYGQTLTKGNQITSATGGYKLVMQTDGNLVLYTATNVPLWYTRTSGSNNRLVMQPDGNLVVYNSSNQPLWHASAGGRGGNRLVVQGDSNLVIYTAGNAAAWWR